jgi:hypothetical protein
MMIPGPDFPWIECDEHGRQMSYAVCRHIAFDGASASAEDSELATPTAMGLIQCAAEHDGILDNFIMMCAEHAKLFMPHEMKGKT